MKKNLILMLKPLFFIWIVVSFVPPASKIDDKMRDLSLLGLIVIVMQEAKEKQ